ncbi:MAG: putative transmembrane DDB_G0289901-like protein [Lasallia pustulata]|uniref:Putative transmembrane DDB_G0289901-like protein n=1 Tax=Lasallia pustulata TaxID=136370 RepID=A0A5M8PLB9_9LECA|nr:MAG: putative transmembrane DDB_G0289901-like protein [Lasallia pustulata]
MALQIPNLETLGQVGQVANHLAWNNEAATNNLLNQVLGQLRVMSNNIDGLRTDVNGLRTDVDGLRTDVNGLRTDVNGLRTDVDGLRTDVNGLRTGVNGLRTAVNGLCTAINATCFNAFETRFSSLDHNVTARIASLELSLPDDELTPLVNRITNQPILNFPNTLAAVDQMPHFHIDYVIAALGGTVQGDMA